MPVVIPFFAIGVALLLLLVAYALAVIFTPVVEGLARNVPVVGGYIARGLDSAIKYAEGKVTGWAEAGADAVVGWLHGLTDAWSDFIEATNAYLVTLPDQLDHLTHVTVHEIVKAFVNPVRDSVADVKTGLDALVASVGDVFTRPLSDFVGIEHGVDSKVDALYDTIVNRDLPNVLDVAEAAAQRGADAVAGQVDALHDAAFADINALFDQLGKIPLQQLLDGLALATGTAALVNVITSEAGLDSAECRSKVKGICATDPLAWQALLDIAGLALLWVGVEEFVRLAQDFARSTLPTIAEAVRGG